MSKKKQAAAQPAPALAGIIERAQLLARTREQLGHMVAELNKGIEAMKAERLPDIRVAIDAASEAWKGLASDIEAHPELFRSPRTLQAHGIKFGFQKGKGGLEIADEDKTVGLIEKLLPDQVALLISVRKAPVKDALAQLSAAELKRLAVNVKDTGDVVFIRPAEGALDKVVKALVAAAVEGE